MKDLVFGGIYKSYEVYLFWCI